MGASDGEGAAESSILVSQALGTQRACSGAGPVSSGNGSVELRRVVLGTWGFGCQKPSFSPGAQGMAGGEVGWWPA